MRLTLVVATERNIHRQFTRFWRHKYRRQLEQLTVSRQLREQGRPVHDAAQLFNVATQQPAEVKLKLFRKYEPPVDNVRQDTPAFIYQGCPLPLTTRQALALTNSVLVSDTLPDSIARLQGQYRLSNQTSLLESVVKDTLMFDATQKKLPHYIDISRLGLPQPRVYGIPRKRAYHALLHGLVDLCDRLPAVATSPNIRQLSHRPLISSHCCGPDGVQLVLRRSPELLLSGERALATVVAVDQLPQLYPQLQLLPPDLAPVSPYVHLKLTRDYDNTDILPFVSSSGIEHVHTVFVSEHSILRHRVTEDRLATLALMSAYMTATAVARTQLLKRGADRHDMSQLQLPQPLTVQCVATDGRHFHFIVLQLNTLHLPPNTHHSRRDQVGTGHTPNLVWSEATGALYDTCAYQSARATLSGLNEAVFERLMAVYLNGVQLPAAADCTLAGADSAAVQATG